MTSVSHFGAQFAVFCLIPKSTAVKQDWRKSCRRVKLTNHLYVTPRLRMRVIVPYIFMAWRSFLTQNLILTKLVKKFLTFY